MMLLLVRILVLVLAVVLSFGVGDPQPIDIPSLSSTTILSSRIHLLVPRNVIPRVVIVPRGRGRDLVLLPVAVHHFRQILVKAHAAPRHGARGRIGTTKVVLVEDRRMHALPVRVVPGVELLLMVVVIGLVWGRVAIALLLHVVAIVVVVVPARGHAVEADGARGLVGRKGDRVTLSTSGAETQGVKGQLAVGAAAAAIARDGGDEDDR